MCCTAQPLLTEALFRRPQVLISHHMPRASHQDRSPIFSWSLDLASIFICHLTLKSLRIGKLLLNESPLCQGRAQCSLHNGIKPAIACSLLWPGSSCMQASAGVLSEHGPAVYFRLLLLPQRFANKVFQSLTFCRCGKVHPFSTHLAILKSTAITCFIFWNFLWK